LVCIIIDLTHYVLVTVLDFQLRCLLVDVISFVRIFESYLHLKILVCRTGLGKLVVQLRRQKPCQNYKYAHCWFEWNRLMLVKDRNKDRALVAVLQNVCMMCCVIILRPVFLTMASEMNINIY